MSEEILEAEPEPRNYQFKIKLLLSYDGTGYSGWQRQKQGEHTIQARVEHALTKLFDKKVTVVASSRTDTGVHALGQVCHAWVPTDPKKRGNILKALNALTPPSIAFHKCWEVPLDFHAIGASEGKIYKYLILNRPTPTALRHRYSYWWRGPLDIDLLNRLAVQFVGTHDFRSLMSSDSDKENTVRTIKMAQWTRKSGGILEFRVEGDGFLKQMVRNMVGTMMWVHQQKLPENRITEILAAKKRTEAGPTAPPEGLFLVKVHYPANLDKKYVKL